MARARAFFWPAPCLVVLSALGEGIPQDANHLVQASTRLDFMADYDEFYGSCQKSGTIINPARVMHQQDLTYCKQSCDDDALCTAYEAHPHSMGFVCYFFHDGPMDMNNNGIQGGGVACYVKLQAAQASGDPHCRNMKGESFDIQTTGEVTMLQVPGPSKRPDFKVTAKIDHINHHDLCGPTVIKEVRISGKWLAHGDAEIVVTPGAHGIPYVHGPWMDIFQNQSAPSGLALSTVGRRTTTNTRLEYLKMTVFETVIKVLQRRGTMSGVNYFDVRINNIKALGKEIGGLLGTDPHEAEVTPPLECQNGKGNARLNTQGAEATSAVQGRMLSVARVE